MEDPSKGEIGPPSCSQFKLTVAYNGYRFNGFQKQPQQPKGGGEATNSHNNSKLKQPPKRPYWDSDTGRIKGVPNTIQDCLEHAILSYIHHHSHNQQQHEAASETPSFSLKDLELRFAGRTDKGVHALGQVVTCRIPPYLQKEQQPLDILLGVNSRLPVDISLTKVEGPLPQPLDPRQEATQKQYSYTLKYHRLSSDKRNNNGNKRASVHSLRHALLDSPRLWLVPWPLCDKTITCLVQTLSGTHDFQHFCHKEARNQYPHHNMAVELEFEVLSCERNSNEGDVVTARFLARSKGFRRTMVRNLVGFCVQMARVEQSSKFLLSSSASQDPQEVAEQKVLDGWEEQVESNRAMIVAAPASGLCLDFVKFD